MGKNIDLEEVIEESTVYQSCTEEIDAENGKLDINLYSGSLKQSEEGMIMKGMNNDNVQAKNSDFEEVIEESLVCQSCNLCIICLEELPKDHKLDSQIQEMFTKECREYGHSNRYHAECWKEYFNTLPTSCAICQRQLDYPELNSGKSNNDGTPSNSEEDRIGWQVLARVTISPYVIISVAIIVYTIGNLVYRLYHALRI